MHGHLNVKYCYISCYPDICLQKIKHAFLTQIRNILWHLLRSRNVLIHLIALDPFYFKIVKEIKQFVCVH